jgi:DNA helicase IV
VDADGYVHDWDQICESIVPVAHPHGGSKVSWGHLIIDEAQDFPEPMFRALSVIMNIIGLQANVKPKPGLTVMADENQRLQAGRNSTIEQIRTALQLPPERVYCLKKNQRNTKEIAAFAASFYVGLKSGIPDLPTRKGSTLPIASISTKDEQGPFWNECAARIARHARSHVSEEIGVLVPNNKMRNSLYNRLVAKLADTKIFVQTYASKDKVHVADKLQFDVGGYVTVLNVASAKGLQFHTVFIVDPGQLFGMGSSEQSTKMMLYVVCSRARDRLELMMPDTEQSKTVLSWVANDKYKREEL